MPEYAEFIPAKCIMEISFLFDGNVSWKSGKV